MQDYTARPLDMPAAKSRDVLTEILRTGAQHLLAQAVEAEVEAWLAEHADCRDAHGRRAVVRNGYLPQRSVLTGIGPVPVRQPRVRERRVPADGERFCSRILPRYLRKTRSVEALIPWLYLKGVSTSQFGEALQALVGLDAEGLSASTVTRLIAGWRQDYDAWQQRSLADRQYVYVWADGVYCNIRLESAENSKQCLLVLMGATLEGQKELIAVQDGYRESTTSWLELLRDCRNRGLTVAPQLAIGDGALGFWSALGQVYPTTRVQRCWVHKTVNVLNKLPKGVQGRAKRQLQAIWMAETKAAAVSAFDDFVVRYEAKYPKASDCLAKDREVLLTFYDFPAEHWLHIRTTNPIESTFATVRLRHDRTKGNGSRLASLVMVFKLCQAAERHWRGLNGANLLPAVVAGVEFQDGLRKAAA